MPNKTHGLELLFDSGSPHMAASFTNEADLFADLSKVEQVGTRAAIPVIDRQTCQTTSRPAMTV